jgi:hypothetical protein
MHDAPRLERLEEFDHRHSLVRVLAELVRRAQVNRKFGRQRHRQRKLESVISKIVEMVTQIAQHKQLVGGVDAQAQESVWFCPEWTDGCPPSFDFAPGLP